MLNNLAILQAEHMDVLHADALASGRNAREQTFVNKRMLAYSAMSSLEIATHNHPIVLRHNGERL